MSARAVLVPRSWACALVLAAAATAALPATGAARSLFNMEGLGRWVEGYDLAARGAGWTAIGVADPSGMSTVNPAGIGWVRNPQAEIGIISENLWVKTATGGGTDRLGSTRIPAIHVAIPGPGFLRWSFGFRDRTDGTYEIRERHNEGREDSFERIREGSGSLSELFATAGVLAWKERASMALRVGVLSGTLRERNQDLYDAPGYLNTDNSLRTRMENAVPVSIGVQAKPSPRVTLGGFFDFASRIDLKSILLTSSGQTFDDRAEIDLPRAIGVGASWRVRRRLRVSADWSRRFWKNADPVFHDTGDTAGGGFAHLEDVDRWGVGITRVADPEQSPRDPVSRRMLWRFGFTHGTLPVTQNDGTTVPEWALTGGFGLPVQFDRGYIDALVEVGKRGNLGEVGLREIFFRLGLGVTFSRLRSTF